MNDRSKPLYGLERWFNRNDSVIQTIHDQPQLLQILQNNLKLRELSHGNLDKLFTKVALNMKELNALALNSVEVLSEGKRLPRILFNK